MIDLPVPFVSNTPDDRHCYQACIKMLLGYFRPEISVSFEELDKITKISHHYTWQYAGDLWLLSQGINISYIENFDHARFSELGAAYMYEYTSEEVAEDQIKNSDIEQEQRLAKDAIERIAIQKRTPTLEDIQERLDQNNLLMCNVNAYALLEEEGYEGHMVLIKGYNDRELIIHDPGLPPQENLTISYKDFERAWAFPHEGVKNLTVYSG